MYGTGLEEKCTILKAMVVSQQAPPASLFLSVDDWKEGSHVRSHMTTSKLSFIAFNSWYTVVTFRQDPLSGCQELLDQPKEFFGFLNLGVMAAVVNHGQL